MNDLAGAIWKGLEPLGFTAEKIPYGGSMPDIPTDVTAEDDSTLMSLFRELTEWSCYAAAQSADAWNRERAAEQHVAGAVARAAVLAKTEKTVAAQKAVAAADPAVREAESELLNASAYRRVLDAVTNNAERRTQLVSRELSRRIASTDRTSRSARWGGA